MPTAKSERHANQAFVTLTQEPPLPLESLSIARLRHRIRIEHRSHPDSPQTHEVAFYGPAEEDFMVVGEAPGLIETRQEQPFVGPAGQLLRGLMGKVGLDNQRGLYTNTVCFWPQDETLKSRPPTDDEIRTRRPELLSELGFGRSQKILLVGATALRVFRPDLKLSSVHGQCFVWGSKWLVMPIYHPAAALRDKFYLNYLREDLLHWKEVVDCDLKHAQWGKFLGLKCIKCLDRMWQYDIDAVPMCKKHWDGGKALAKGRKFWGQSFAGEQLSLLAEAAIPDISDIDGAQKLDQPL